MHQTLTNINHLQTNSFKYTLKPLSGNRQKEALTFLSHNECECVTLTEHVLSTVEDVYVLDAVDSVSGSSFIQAIFFYRKNSAIYPCIPFTKNSQSDAFLSQEVRKCFADFMNGKRVFSITGQADAVTYLVEIQKDFNSPLRVINNYLLMVKEAGRSPKVVKEIPDGFKLKKAGPKDINSLIELEYAYQIEEVMNGDASRLYKPGIQLQFENLLKNQQIFALFNGKDQKAVAKAGTNARGKNFCQIGGVFCDGQQRNHGYAFMVVKKVVDAIEAAGKTACLFVKEKNASARRVYENCGFEYCGKFMIAYYDV